MSATTELIDNLELQEPPQPFQLDAWMLAAAVLVLAALCGFIWYCKKKQAARGRAKVVAQSFSDALAELERLFALVDQEQSRPYAIESSAIIRRYIEARFELEAPRRSTEEFLAEAGHSPKLAPTHQALLGEYLQVCDLLKFARTFANRSELHHLHDAAVRFVKETHRPSTQSAPGTRVSA
jgi:hypothetical protein